MAWIAETEDGRETFATQDGALIHVVLPAKQAGKWVSLRHLNEATGREGTAMQWVGQRRVFPPYREDYDLMGPSAQRFLAAL
jgi:hypothetical protein